PYLSIKQTVSLLAVATLNRVATTARKLTVCFTLRKQDGQECLSYLEFIAPIHHPRGTTSAA
ncbi:MAG TPA: hypothetical protein VGO73_14415, partial [Pyrinomonadaceae bacterium]|nr:hypothetical protein [Pyrinomonadaceae bacterium]